MKIEHIRNSLAIALRGGYDADYIVQIIEMLIEAKIAELSKSSDPREDSWIQREDP